MKEYSAKRHHNTLNYAATTANSISSIPSTGYNRSSDVARIEAAAQGNLPFETNLH